MAMSRSLAKKEKTMIENLGSPGGSDKEAS
jgi:hypothetical protein